MTEIGLTDDQWREIVVATVNTVRLREAKKYSQKDFALAAPAEGGADE